MSVVSRGEKAINERYRPAKFSELLGSELNKQRLHTWMERGEKRTKALLLSGASGCGKTTTARILAMGLNCEKGDTDEPCLECPSCKAALENSAFHIVEHNMSEMNTKDAVDEIVSTMRERCVTGRNKVYILDEAQKLTNSSQNLLLKIVENPPQNVYIIFCTTEPDNIIKTLQNRCEHYKYTLPTDNDIKNILRDVVTQENLEMTNEEKRELFDYVKGMSYREILFAVEQYTASKGNIEGSMPFSQGVNLFELAKKIIYNGDFSAFQTVMSSNDNLELEPFRCMLRKMASNEILKNGFNNLKKAALYSDVLTKLSEKRFIDSNPIPDAVNVIFQICFDIQSNK